MSNLLKIRVKRKSGEGLQDVHVSSVPEKRHSCQKGDF